MRAMRFVPGNKARTSSYIVKQANLATLSSLGIDKDIGITKPVGQDVAEP